MPALCERSAGKRLQENDLTWQDRHDAAEALLLGIFHLPQLLELRGIEELGVRIELPQHGRDGPVIDELVNWRLIRSLRLHGGKNVDELLEQRN